MTMYNETCDCKVTPIAPGNMPISGMLNEANDFTQKALAMAMQVNASCFGKQAKEQKIGDSRCMRDAIALHVDDLKALCEELHDILEGLGV